MEAVMICIDNSEWMRNGDFHPTRMRAQILAIRFLCNAIIGSNAKNTVGVLTMAGKNVRVEISLTNDINKLLQILQTIEIVGEANVKAGIQVAHLALKHREHKKHTQRIIVITGSPWTHESKGELKMIGSNLRKNSVVLDVVHFDDEIYDDGKFDKIYGLIDANGSNGNYNIAYVLQCSCFTAELMRREYGLFKRYYSENPSLENQLTIELHAYMEEEEEAAAAEDAERGKNGSSQQCSSEANNNMRNDQTADDDEEEDEDDLLQKVLDMKQKVLGMSKDAKQYQI